jgi:ectoine hydroxylase-related dioxygenase (phytanoyl-CoA dioxygenase family)
MTDELPGPTTDLAQARADLAHHGYCVLRDALPPTILQAVRDRVVEQAEGERVLGIGREEGVDPERFIGGSGRGEGNNGRVWTLVNKGEVFQHLLLQPDVKALVAEVLGTPFLLSSIQANLVSPGDKALPSHSDQGYVPRPWPAYSMTASVIWMLDAFTEHNGATTVIPGTHVGSEPVEEQVAMSRARLFRRGGIPVCGPAGSALVFDGRIVHGTGVNTTDKRRLGILTYFCRPFMRQQENFTLSVAPDVLPTLPAEVKALLGFQVWKTLGSVEGVCAENAFVTRPARSLGPVDTTGRPHPTSAADAAALGAR